MKRRSGLEVMMRLIGLVKPLSGYMVLAVLMGLAGHLCATFLTVFGGYGVLQLMKAEVPFSMSVLFGGVVVFAALRGILRYGEQACNHFIAFKLLALLRDKVFRALRRLCPAKLEGRDKGNLIAVITSDIELLEVFYAHTISPVLIAVLFTLFLCGYIGSFHIALGILALAAYLFIGLGVPLVISKLSGEDGMRFRKKSGELSSFVLDSLRGLPETLQYGGAEKRLQDMEAQTIALAKEEAHMKQVAGINGAITNGMILFWDFVMLFTAMSFYEKGQLGIDGVLLSTVALMSSYGPVVALANLGSTLQNTLAAGNRVLDILEEMPVVEDITCGKEVSFEGAAVDKVSFTYGTQEILSDISVEIPPNTVVGIVGKSGSGKSTLLKLLMRFWDVKEGEVKISDTSVSEINTASLRAMESYMTQETHLFHDSIRNNLRIAKWDATEEEMQKACQKASVHDFIMSLPKGYDTPVGELGDTLSGGERQRLGLARAFLHNAPLLLLDEPTSNLDSLNEAVILKSLLREREDKTVVLVSHRESTMRIAEKVYSLEQGIGS